MMTRVTFETPCHICTSFTDEQMKKIQNRKRYLKKQKAETSSKDNELDLLGEGDGDSFTGSNADLESAADNLFTSPPVLSHLPSVLYLSKHQPSLSLPPQVQLYNKKFKQILKNPFTATNGFLSGIHVGSFSVASRGVDYQKANRGGSDLVSCFQTWYIQS